MRKLWLWLWVFCGVMVRLSSAWAEDPNGPVDPSTFPFQLEAGEIAYEPDRNLYEAAGNVRVVQQDGSTLECDWLAFNAQTQVGIAVGNVVMTGGVATLTGERDTVRADFATVDLKTLVALATDAKLDTPEQGFVIEGKAIEKTGVNTYEIEDGTFTTCRCPPDHKRRPWEIDTKRTDVRVGGYGVARGMTLRVLDVPVLWAPWAIFPVKTERQTGFLFPGYSSSTRLGTWYTTPFFWAASDNVNILLRPTIYSRRGFKGTTEFEYVFDEYGKGLGGFAFLPNDDGVDRSTDPRTPFADDRWAGWLWHNQPFADGMRFAFDIKKVSDNDYVLDFNDLGFDSDKMRFLESSGWASYGRGSWFASIEASTLDDVQSPNNLDRDDFLLQRLPDVRLQRLPRQVSSSPLHVAVDSRYTYFYQEASVRTLRGAMPIGKNFFDTGRDGVFTPDEPTSGGAFNGADNHGDDLTTEGDGIFQEGELLADHGHRFDVFPRVSMPNQFGNFELLSELGARETLYFPEFASSETRTLWTGRWDLRTRFGKEVRFGSTKMKHLIEPKAGFVFVSGPRQSRNPLFIPASSVRARRLIDGDLRVLTHDPSDRVSDERFAHIGFKTRLLAPSLTTLGSVRQIADLQVGTGYNFQAGQAATLFADGNFSPREYLNFGTEFGYDIKDGALDEVDLSMDLSAERGDRLSLGYRFVREFSAVFENFNVSDKVFTEFSRGFNQINQFDFKGIWMPSKRLDIFGQGNVSLETSGSDNTQFGVTYHSSCECWDLSFLVENKTRPRETLLFFQLTAAGFGIGSFDLSFKQDEEKRR